MSVPYGSFSLENFEVERLLYSNKLKLAVLIRNRSTRTCGILELARYKPKFKSLRSNLNNIVLLIYVENDVHHMAKLALADQRYDCMFIYPASERYIEMFEFTPKFGTETAEFYNLFIRPGLNNMPSCRWIYNLLEGTAEQERTILRDDDPHIGFVLARNDYGQANYTHDSKFCAFVMRRDLRSVRDLTTNECPLLQNLLTKCIDKIQSLTGIQRDEIDAFFHYHPKYWHLHIHFQTSRYDPSRAHIKVWDAIKNLERDSDYYKKIQLGVVSKFPIGGGKRKFVNAEKTSIQSEPNSNATQQLIAVQARIDQSKTSKVAITGHAIGSTLNSLVTAHVESTQLVCKISGTKAQTPKPQKKKVEIGTQTPVQDHSPPIYFSSFIDFDDSDVPARKKPKLEEPSNYLTLFIPNPIVVVRNAFKSMFNKISSFFGVC